MKLIMVILGLGILFGQVAWSGSTDEEQADHLMQKIYDMVSPAGQADVNVSDQIDKCNDYLAKCFDRLHFWSSTPWKSLGGGWCPVIASGNFTNVRADLTKFIRDNKKDLKPNTSCDLDQDIDYQKTHSASGK